MFGEYLCECFLKHMCEGFSRMYTYLSVDGIAGPYVDVHFQLS